jgi:UDP-N-acetylmuramoyl-L-alanyl-D-glutamate--2,6-diaminopimelate ligase
LSKNFKEILDALSPEYEIITGNVIDNNPIINGISINSKTVSPGDLFVCLVGENFDAHNFALDAVKRGANAVLAQKAIPDLNVPVAIVENTAKSLSLISAYYYDYPGSRMRLVGITGTNGKTTVTHLVEKILEKYDKSCGLIGTLGHRFKSTENYIDNKHTTPQAPDLQKYLAEMVQNNIDYVVMEVSSHALDLYRVLDCDFAVALLTNITQDHLDFHVTMENYANAKLKLFKALAESRVENRCGIINIDDPMAEQFIDVIPDNDRTLTYGIYKKADIQAVDIKDTVEHTIFNCITPAGAFEVKLKLKGQFSIYNSLAAISVAIAENVPISVIQDALAEIENIPGRFEAISKKPLIIVDYAHTPDGLSNILSAARNLVPEGGNLITVFGCGGDRDPTKRPKMGKITEEMSDKVIVTSDNPRTEDPQQIITDILTGIRSLNSGHVKVEIDRATAIEMAINLAKTEDVVVIAGKGHEDYQILADRTIHFDDREVVREVLNKLNPVK